MNKYVAMVGGVALLSILGGVGVVYSFVASAPFSITRQNTLPETEVAATEKAALADAASTMTITVH